MGQPGSPHITHVCYVTIRCLGSLAVDGEREGEEAKQNDIGGLSG